MKKILKIVKRLFLFLSLLILILFILIQFGGVQRYIATIVKDKILVEQGLSDIQFERIRIGLSGKISLYKLNVPADNLGPLISIEKLKVKISIAALLKRKMIFKSVLLNGAKGQVYHFTSNSYNFSRFLPERSDSIKKATNNNLVFEVGRVEINDLNFRFHDSISQVYLDVNLGHFQTNLSGSNIANLDFQFNKIQLSNTKVILGLDESLTPKIDKAPKENPLLPVIIANALKLDDVSFILNDFSKSSFLEAIVDRVNGKDILVDINRELVEVGNMKLENSKYIMDYTADTIIEQSNKNGLVEIPTKLDFSGGWSIKANNVKGINNTVLLQLKELADSARVFYPQNFSFSNIDFSANKAIVQHDLIRANIKEVSCIGDNNFELKEAAIDFSMNENLGKFKFKKLKTTDSHISADIDISMPLTKPDFKETIVTKLLIQGNLSTSELLYFLPQLSLDNKMPYNESLGLDIDIVGNIDQVKISRLNILSSQFLTINASGVINGYTVPDSMTFKIIVDTFALNPELLLTNSYLPSTENAWPLLFGKLGLSGDIRQLTASFKLSNKEGQIKGDIQSSRDSLKYLTEASIKFNNIDLSSYIDDTTHSNIGGTISISSYTQGISTLDSVSAIGYLNNLNYGKANISDVKLDGNYSAESFIFHANHTSEYIDFDAKISGIVQKDSIDIIYELLVDKFNTKHFSLTKEEFQIASQLRGKFLYIGPEEYKNISYLDNIDIRFKEEDYNFNSTNFSYIKLGKSISAKLKTDGAQFYLKSNIPYKEAREEWMIFLRRNLNLEAEYIPEESKKFIFRCQIESPRMAQKFIGEILSDTLIIDSIKLDYNIQERLFHLSAGIPKISLGNVAFDNFRSNTTFRSNSFYSRINLDKIAFNNFHSNKIKIEGESLFNDVVNTLKIYNSEGLITSSIPIRITQTDSIIGFGLGPDSIIIGNNNWVTTNDIALRYSYKTKEWSSDGVRISHQDKFLQFEETPNEVIVKAENLDFASSMYFINSNKNKLITEGMLSGNFSLIRVNQTEWYINSNINIKDIYLYDESYGNLSLALLQDSVDSYKVDLKILNNNDFLDYSGSLGKYSKKRHTAKANIKDLSKYSSIIDTNRLNFQEGELSAELRAQISDEGPLVTGFFGLKNAIVYLPDVGSRLEILDEKVDFTESGIHFNNVSIEDVIGNKLVVDGDVLTDNYKDFNFDLAINSDYFQIFNSTKEQNKDLYGNLIVSTNFTIGGTSIAPELDVRLKVHEKTDFTFVIPGGDPLQNSSEDIVKFSDVSNESDSVYIMNSISVVSDSIERVMSQGKFKIVLSFNPDARYTIITNELSGDFARFGLNGTMIYKTATSGITEVNGNIQIVEGVYEMSFYEMVKKEFTIEPQSTVYFSGPINNTTLDIKAKNIVKTNSLALMSNESIGNSPEEKALYNQRLPYELYFVVNGLLLNPNVSFALDLPDDYKQNSPMIASKLNKLSSPEMEQERNMQVFALLVTGGFIAENSSVASGSGTSDVATTTARNSVNSILSQQLNRVASDNIEFVDLNLGLNTYEDYARRGGQTTTDLDVQISKKLFDDKVSFEMDSRINLDGSGSPNQSTSNYNTDYKLYYNINESGSYKLKAYNLSIYDLFDGDITNTGFGLMFSKDFNSKKRKNYVELETENLDE